MASDSKLQTPDGDQVRPRIAVPRPASRAIEGIILAHGSARYNDDKDEKLSYFINLQTANGGQKKVWGVDLQRAVEDGNFQTGDAVRLEQTGAKSVEVEANRRDESGKVIGQETITANRNAWAVQRIEKLTPAVSVVKKSGSGAASASATKPAPTDEQPDGEVPPFKIKFSKAGRDGNVQDFPLEATRLQEAKVEAFRQLARLGEDIDHLEIHQNGKLICQCSFDYEKGRWGDWTKPRRDCVEAPYTPAQDAVWKEEEARLRAADEARKAGIKPGGGDVKTVEPSQRVPRIAFTGQARAPMPGEHKTGAARILSSLPEAEQRQINQQAANRAKASTAALAKAAETASSRPTAATAAPRGDRHEYDRHQAARQHDVQRQVRERQGQH